MARPVIGRAGAGHHAGDQAAQTPSGSESPNVAEMPATMRSGSDDEHRVGKGDRRRADAGRASPAPAHDHSGVPFF